MQPVNLISLVAGLVDGLKPVIDAQGVSFYSTITAESARITGDPGMLQQAIWALCEEAIGASRGGRVEMRIERVGKRARLTLVHAGSPIDARRTPAQRAVGAGAVPPLRAVVEQHGGTLALTSDGARGVASAVLEFPLREPEALPPVGEAVAEVGAGPAALPGVSIGGVCVLVVDDNDEAREKLEGHLHARDALSRGYPSGAAALVWLRDLPRPDWPDVLVCDLSLGDEDSYEIIQQLRQLEAERGFALTERLPAIAIGGQAKPEQRTRALLAGFQMHLAAPVDQDELMAAIAALAGHTGAFRAVA